MIGRLALAAPRRSAPRGERPSGLNKALALDAFLLLTRNFGLGPLNNLTGRAPEGWLNARRALGMTGFLLALVHALTSFLLFKREVYAQFFLGLDELVRG